MLPAAWNVADSPGLFFALLTLLAFLTLLALIVFPDLLAFLIFLVLLTFLVFLSHFVVLRCVEKTQSHMSLESDLIQVNGCEKTAVNFRGLNEIGYSNPANEFRRSMHRGSVIATRKKPGRRRAGDAVEPLRAIVA